MNTAETNIRAVVNDNEASTDEASTNENNDESPAPAPDEQDMGQARRLLEALLFASAGPLSERKLAGRVAEGIDVKACLKSLQKDYGGRGVNLVRTGASWAFRTADDLGALLNVETEVSRKMNRAGIETMAVIAYHQPVTRAEIEDIRGVSLSKGTLDLLFEKEWIKPRGRRETPGRPMTWGTTDVFLDHFGLSRVTDLPGLDELKAAGLLENGPALNVYRAQDADIHDVQAGTQNHDTGEDVFPELDDSPEPDEPLDPEQ